MLFKKLLRTIWHYKAQFISMIIMVLLGVGVFVGFQGEWYSIEKDTYSFYDSTGFADYRLVSETGYTSEEMDKISIDSIVEDICLDIIKNKYNDSVFKIIPKLVGKYMKCHHDSVDYRAIFGFLMVV